MATYPKREQFFANKFCRLLTKMAVAQEIGAEACWLLTVVALQEDVIRYARPVTFFNEQLMTLCGIRSKATLIRARDRAVEAGWLEYETGGTRKAGRYFVTIPSLYATEDDSPTEEGNASIGSNTEPITPDWGQDRNQSETNAKPMRDQSETNAKPIRGAIIPNPIPTPVPKKKKTKKASPPKPSYLPLDAILVAIDYPDQWDRPDVRTAVGEWIEYKRKRGEAYKDPVFQVGKQLTQFARDGPPERFVAAVDHSIANNWAGCHAPKEQAHGTSKNGGTNLRRAPSPARPRERDWGRILEAKNAKPPQAPDRGDGPAEHEFR